MGKLFNNPVSRVAAYSRVGAYSRGVLNRSITVSFFTCSGIGQRTNKRLPRARFPLPRAYVCYKAATVSVNLLPRKYGIGD